MRYALLPMDRVQGRSLDEVVDSLREHGADVDVVGIDERGIARAPQLPGNAEVLKNSSWMRSDPTTATWNAIHFGETTITDEDATGVRTYTADFGANHPQCGAAPYCVVVAEGEGSGRVLHLDHDAGQLIEVDCVDWRVRGQGDGLPSNEAIEENSPYRVVARDDPWLCLRAPDSPSYQRLPARGTPSPFEVNRLVRGASGMPLGGSPMGP